MIIGVFSPVLNWCGGAEWVAVNIISALKENGHHVITLTDIPLNQDKIMHVFGKRLSVDQQLVLPIRVFSPTNNRNIYSDALRSLVLKSKCNILIDTFSNAILPGADVCYIHYPLLRGIKTGQPYLRNLLYFYPYKTFLASKRSSIKKRLIFANSSYTAEAIKAELGIKPYVLYPSVSNNLLYHNKPLLDIERGNNVITIGRICEGKNLQIIPHIARLTSKEISFTIVGLLESEKALDSLQKLLIKFGLKERVKIITNAKRETLKQLLACSRVYLHSKKNEHFGISIVEAMSLGCIPVVHDSGGPKEFVPDTFRFKTIEEAADKVELAIKQWSPKKAKDISRDAERFSESNFSKQFIKIFNKYVEYV